MENIIKKNGNTIIKQQILSESIGSNYSFDFLEDIIKMNCFSIINRTDDLKFLNDRNIQQWISFNNFVIFGTGGSSLCGQCINLISKSIGLCKKKLTFVSNLDPNSLELIFKEIDLINTGFLFISKSGETLETITHLLLIIEKFVPQENSYEFIKSKFVIITEEKMSSLRQIATKNNMLCLPHPVNIGGRFSVFSIVGMLPAFLSGMNPIRIRNGAKDYIENNIDEVKKGASFIAQNINNQITQHVSFFYSDKLAIFGKWLEQLYAESSGKSGTGITPITAIGAVDQHSQLQLYLDGPRNKCFTFFYEKQISDLTVKQKNIPEAFNFLNDKKVSDVFAAQCNATILSIMENNLNIRTFALEKITPEMLGMLFMHFMLEVICVCRILRINPFDQPAVEQGKTLIKELLVL